MAESKPNVVPLNPYVKLSREVDPEQDSSTYPYKEVVGSLMYL
jgi:hypothetical protein